MSTESKAFNVFFSAARHNFMSGMKHYAGILIALIVLCIFFSVMNEHFMTERNVNNILQQIAVVAIAAFGMTWVILLGDIDLSIGSAIAVAGMVGAQVLALGWGVPTAILLSLLTGAALGGFNGLMVAKLGLPSFIVTVATMGIYRGLVNLPTNGAPEGIVAPSWIAIGNASWLGYPVVIWILLVLFLINHVLLSRTTFGRRAYLIGGNKEAAMYSGIKVGRMKIAIFTLCTSLAAVSGIILSSRLYSAQTNAGESYELDAIAAVVLGGASLSGGVGTMFGTLIGALIIGVMNNGMNMLSVPYFYQLIVKGIVILLAVWLDVRAKQKRR